MIENVHTGEQIEFEIRTAEVLTPHRGWPASLKASCLDTALQAQKSRT